MSHVPWEWIVTESLRRRQAWAGFRRSTAHRVIDGAADAAPAGVAVDRYADHLVVWLRPHVDERSLDGLEAALMQRFVPRAMVRKRLGSRFEDSRSEVLRGVPADELRVTDDGVKLSARVHPSVQTGVFLDLRPARRFVRAHAHRARVLNLFAHTGAFSVHAAAGGAARITTVDAARRALRVGRRSFELNEIDPDAHRWFADDAVSVLRRADPGGYDLVVLDPPAFGRAGRKRFVLRTALDGLLRDGLRSTAAGGHLLVSSHDPDLDLHVAVQRALGAMGPGARVAWRLTPDPDFPGLHRTRKDEVSVALQALAIRVGG